MAEKTGTPYGSLGAVGGNLKSDDGIMVHRGTSLQGMTGQELTDGVLDILNKDIQFMKHFNPGTYDGRDLSVVFAKEIANFAGPWEWIQDRINNENDAGLIDGDYIPLTMTNGEVFDEQINIAPYQRSGDSEIPFHIDFISKDAGVDTVQWNTTNNNNGTADQYNPYIASNLHKWLNETMYGRVPANVQKMITVKRALVEDRYSSSGALTDSTGWHWDNGGKLWVPTEVEIFRFNIWSTKGYGTGNSIRYPVFANWRNTVKGSGKGGTRCAWWEASARSGNSTYACSVDSPGNANSWSASNAAHVPVCFRICKANA